MGQGKSLNKVGVAGFAHTCIGGAKYPDSFFSCKIDKFTTCGLMVDGVSKIDDPQAH